MSTDPFSDDFEPATGSNPKPPDPFKEDNMSTPGMTVNRMSEAFTENDKTRKSKRTPIVPCEPQPPEEWTIMDLLRSGYSQGVR